MMLILVLGPILMHVARLSIFSMNSSITKLITVCDRGQPCFTPIYLDFSCPVHVLNFGVYSVHLV
jgi:hypothetical protein